MGRTAVSAREKAKNNAVIEKIATKAAKKAVSKTAEKVARATSRRVATKVAQETSLNPDYNPEEEFDGEEEEEETSLFGNFQDEDEDEDNDGGPEGYEYPNDEEEEEEEEDNTDLTHQTRSKDIFTVADDEIRKGKAIRIQVKKNGHFLATYRKPYSEEQLQKDHGEGHYQIILRDDIKGTFIKQQSLSVAAPSTPPAAEIAKLHQEQKQNEDQKIDKMFTTFSDMQQRSAETQSQMIERIMQEQERREEQERERRKEERELMKESEKNNMNVLATVLQASLNKPSDNGGMTGILQMMQSQQQQTSMMIMEMNKNFMNVIQDMKKDTDRMVDKITSMSQEQAKEFRQQLSEMQNKKPAEGFDALKMFEMLNKTRDDGLNFGLKLQSMAKDLAGENEAAPSAPKGIVESVLDNLGKLAPLMIAAGQNNNASQHFQAPPAPRPALVATPPAPSYRAPARPAPAPASNPAPARPAPVKAAPEARTVPATSTPVKTPAPTKATPQGARAGVKKTTTQTSVASGPETGKIGNDVELKKAIIEICVPLIGHALQNNINSGGLGDATINALTAQGIDLGKAVSVVGVQDIYDTAFNQFKLPDVPELRAYLKDYYDYLAQKASTTEPRQVT